MNDLDRRLRQCLLPVPAAWEATASRRAAVLCPIVATASGPAVLLLVRPQDMSLHPGQIAFPGGSDDGDSGPVACALRETTEEIGLLPQRVRVLGSLPNRRSSSDFDVHCVVGLVDDLLTEDQLTPSPREVERVLLVPFAELTAIASWEHRAPPPTAARPQSQRQPQPSPHFEWRGELVWGLTGRFCFDLATRLAADAGRAQ